MFPAAKRILLPSWLLAFWIITAAWTCLPDTSKNHVWKNFCYSLQTGLQKVSFYSVNQQDKCLLQRQLALELPIDPDGRFGKQAFNVGAANVATAGGIPTSMALGGGAFLANKVGLTNLGKGLNRASGSVLQGVANTWSAANEGPMGRVFDKQIHATTGLLKPVIGQHNQQFLASWLTGSSPSSVTYGADSPQVRDMQNSLNVSQARKDFHAQGAPSRVPFGHDTVPAYKETILNPATLNWKSTAMQVGGYRDATITNNNDGTATYNIRNVAGANSFFLHMVPNLPGTSGPMRNVEQTFRWTESINP